ncbi:MAG: hypothetical protein AAGG46_06610 [Planctomycetota bacterium]
MPSEPEHVNPFAAPLLSDSPAAELKSAGLSESEVIRNELLRTESSIKSIATIYLLSGVVWTVIGVILAGAMIFAQNGDFDGGESGPIFVAIGCAMAVLGGASVWYAFGLRRLDSQVRTPVLLIQSISMLVHVLRLNIFGIGIGIWVLVTLSSDNGKRVLTPEYQEIVAATPHIKRKTSLLVWIFLILLLVLVGVGVLAAVFGG